MTNVTEIANEMFSWTPISEMSAARLLHEAECMEAFAPVFGDEAEATEVANYLRTLAAERA